MLYEFLYFETYFGRFCSISTASIWATCVYMFEFTIRLFYYRNMANLAIAICSTMFVWTICNMYHWKILANRDFFLSKLYAIEIVFSYLKKMKKVSFWFFQPVHDSTIWILFICFDDIFYTKICGPSKSMYNICTTIMITQCVYEMTTSTGNKSESAIRFSSKIG